MLAPAFSEKAMKDQESISKQWAALMVSKLQVVTRKGKAANLVDYFDFTTTDIMADLTFSEGLDMLKSSE